MFFKNFKGDIPETEYDGDTTEFGDKTTTGAASSEESSEESDSDSSSDASSSSDSGTYATLSGEDFQNSYWIACLLHVIKK